MRPLPVGPLTFTVFYPTLQNLHWLSVRRHRVTFNGDDLAWTGDTIQLAYVAHVYLQDFSSYCMEDAVVKYPDRIQTLNSTVSQCETVCRARYGVARSSAVAVIVDRAAYDIRYTDKSDKLSNRLRLQVYERLV